MWKLENKLKQINLLVDVGIYLLKNFSFRMCSLRDMLQILILMFVVLNHKSCLMFSLNLDG